MATTDLTKRSWSNFFFPGARKNSSIPDDTPNGLLSLSLFTGAGVTAALFLTATLTISLAITSGVGTAAGLCILAALWYWRKDIGNWFSHKYSSTASQAKEPAPSAEVKPKAKFSPSELKQLVPQNGNVQPNNQPATPPSSASISYSSSEIACQLQPL